ncbi:type I toxin-antitoxin system antitoxin YafN [Marinobacter halodurans]|uniref:Type I toxin-antitoxin system antitoxin YafN n=1 Tax=Marinobacter halodurans TaxID=2528979 RepID=A0ABY1ZMH3_9GAMM|nr:type I toxin-antitoxin system antitoxin YafN [Marinobacter halodurans]TBW57391.1 type I toxin-antitoxin system antitoxin YafN [Marinobacter halodurans]
MATHAILAEKTVSISALRNNPAQYFSDQPIAVLSHNKPAGYVVGAELFEYMMKVIETQTEARSFEARFRPSVAQLKELRARGAELVLEMTPEDMEDYEE